MTVRIPRLLPALGACLVSATALAACGSDDSIPGNSVARVGDTNIERSEFRHWLAIASSSQAAQTGAKPGSAAVPRPPAFTACVAGKRKSAPKPAQGQPAPTTAQFKTQCKQEYDSLRDQALGFLINYERFKGEAADRDIKVTDAAVNKQLATARKQTFPKDADFQKFLKQSSLTLDDIRQQIRLGLWQTKLREKVTKDSEKISAKDISEYYDKNRKNFAQPERRDLRIVLTKEKGRADAALAALKGGQSFGAVAKQYSIDGPSKGQGGVLKGVGKGQQIQALDRKIFSAKKGVLTGPVKTQFGYYVFKVQKVTAPSQQSLKEATPAIRQLLTAQGGQKAADKFSKTFTKKWKSRTNCRKAFKMELCKGEKTPTQPAGGGQGQPQAPQQDGGQAQPPQGGGQAPPPQGGGQAPPPQGGGQAPPPQGGGQAPPPQGGGQAPPPQGGQGAPVPAQP